MYSRRVYRDCMSTEPATLPIALPEHASPVISIVLRRVAHVLSADQLASISAVIPLAPYTGLERSERADRIAQDEERRMWIAVDHLVRDTMPRVLEAAGRPEQAAAWRTNEALDGYAAAKRFARASHAGAGAGGGELADAVWCIVLDAAHADVREQAQEVAAEVADLLAADAGGDQADLLRRMCAVGALDGASPRSL